MLGTFLYFDLFFFFFFLNFFFFFFFFFFFRISLFLLELFIVGISKVENPLKQFGWMLFQMG